MVSQLLLPRHGAPGRALALEVLVPNAAIRNLIREDKIHQIYSHMQVGRLKHGMQTINQSLYGLYSRGDISIEEAMLRSGDVDELQGMIDAKSMDAGEIQARRLAERAGRDPGKR